MTKVMAEGQPRFYGPCVGMKEHNVMNHITGNTSVAEIVKVCPGARRIFDEHGLKGCGGERDPVNH